MLETNKNFITKLRRKYLISQKYFILLTNKDEEKFDFYSVLSRLIEIVHDRSVKVADSSRKEIN